MMLHRQIFAILFLCLVVHQSTGQMHSLERIKHIQSLVPNISILQSINKLVPNIDQLPLNAIEDCFDNGLNQTIINFFEEGITLYEIVHNYYESLPEKKLTAKSVLNLIESVKEICEHVIECVEKPRQYKLGFTSMSDKSDEDFEKFWGFSDIMGLIDNTANSAECYPPSSFQEPKNINWKDSGIVTPVRNQQQCGSCWAFATTAALESAYLRYNKSTDTRLEFSNQQLVDCATDSDGCGGGTSFAAYKYIKSNGITSEDEYPYTGESEMCFDRFVSETGQIRSRCIRGKNKYSLLLKPENLSDQDIRKAVAYYGPVTICLNASKIKNYKSGYFDNPRCSSQINHMVLLVGYTDKGWVMKNSWGPNWGDNGYFRMVSGKNMCGTNFEISYPLL